MRQNPPDLNIKSTSTNIPLVPTNVVGTLNRFASAMKKEFQSRKRDNSTNLTKLQKNILHYFINQRENIVLHSDKDLGPYAMNLEKRIKQCIDQHLSDANCYKRITEEVATEDVANTME